MSGENLRQIKIDRIRRRESLDGLLGHADRLELISARARVRDKLPPPVDDHGIPRVDIMIRGLLGQMATTAYVWTGKFDLHHMATPKADYSVVPDNVGAAFRSLSALKIEMPRQMHNFAHELFLTPRNPPTDAVMRQAVLENEQLRTLQESTDKVLEGILREEDIQIIIEGMVEARVDIMPSRETLADMEFYELRQAVSSLTRVRRYANKPLIHPAVRPRAALRHKVA